MKKASARMATVFLWVLARCVSSVAAIVPKSHNEGGLELPKNPPFTG